MPSPLKNIGMIGCGNMGGGLLHGFLKSNIANHYHIIKPSPLNADFAGAPQVSHYKTPKDAENIFADLQILILATKPQIMLDVCKDLKAHLKPETLIISVAAGLSIAQLETVLSANHPIMRAMPNTPAIIQKSMTSLTGNKASTSKHKEWADKLFQAVGKVMHIEDEQHFHAITALSGSGPAYLFYMIEALSNAGEQSGLPRDVAATLARQTIIGAASLAEIQSNEAISTLRENVTSPGGTTEAGLNILMNGKFQEILNETVLAAKKRGKELDKA